MPTSAGQKVKDPSATKSEPTGLVTSDSLAAESLSSSGAGFAANNPHAAASKQPSYSTTSNTTDTSGATTLPPAADSETREAQQGSSASNQLDTGKGLGKESGVGPTYNTSSSAKSGSGGGTSGSGNTRAGEDFMKAGTAPTGGYAGASDQARSAGELRPHGANITEDPNLSGKTARADIGTENDPARAAELKFQKSDAMPGGATGGGKDFSKQAGESKFSGLGDEAA